MTREIVIRRDGERPVGLAHRVTRATQEVQIERQRVRPGHFQKKFGRELLKFWQLDEISMEKAAKQTLADLKVVSVRSIRQPVGSLSGGQRQSVAVAKAVLRQAQMVILDEPTAALGVTQTRNVLELIARLASQGIGVILISHNLNDVFAVADRVAVLRLGYLVAAGPKSQFDSESIVDLMTTGTSKRLAAQAAEPASSSHQGSPSEH